ncbi:hypothetical protein ARALYDRAFT_915115 [Arabidopsis lyrata subsp. lyrata]|uniref:PWWP domain-containing protein n=1 Tax=Arabidopsis lyrata subsp. lyrata TaxID=81972 RepID=D7M9V8_ARALL|nr:hypothetical protein ARALYDRAFT_915115 [Arabidopsis lyrata subsp. lyrata]
MESMVLVSQLLSQSVWSMALGRKRGMNKAMAIGELILGDLVLAKVKGFPAWPAKVCVMRSLAFTTLWFMIMIFRFGLSNIIVWISLALHIESSSI